MSTPMNSVHPTAPATRLTVAIPKVVPFEPVAVIVTACETEIVVGAVYRPDADILPDAGSVGLLTDQVMFSLVSPITCAVNRCVCLEVRLIFGGLTLTCGGALHRIEKDSADHGVLGIQSRLCKRAPGIHRLVCSRPFPLPMRGCRLYPFSQEIVH